MGLSRDDYTKFQKNYEEPKIFKPDPFAVLDQQGVGKLIEMAVETRPQDAAESRNRHLRRARRRAELGAVLLSGGHELCILLALSRADRAAGRGASRHLRR